MTKLGGLSLIASWILFIGVAQSHASEITLLHANIGNKNLRSDAKMKLEYSNVETRVKQRIHDITPDVVSLIEVMPDWLCRAGKASSKNKVCNGYEAASVRDQIRRLLGDDYTIVCSPVKGWDCLGIKKNIAEIMPDPEGQACPAGHLCGTPDVFSVGESKTKNAEKYFSKFEPLYNTSEFDDGFISFVVDVKMKGENIRIIVAHPQSGTTTTKQSARAKQIEQIFAEWVPQNPTKKTLILGDMNLDPYRNFQDESVQTWNRYVDNYDSQGKPTNARDFHYHSGIVERASDPFYTSHSNPLAFVAGERNQTIDHVISNFANGSCVTLRGSRNLDGGSGMDHDALECEIGL